MPNRNQKQSHWTLGEQLQYAKTALAEVWPTQVESSTYESYLKRPTLHLPPGVKLAKWRKRILWTNGAANRRQK
jgi:hypothetical protein